jgi:uncharacterized repeat protein (TIGR03809 family)
LNPFVVTQRRQSAARLRCLMTDRPALREFGKIAEKWRDLAEKRRDYFAELYRSGRWRIYYEQDDLLAQTREVAEICDRWAAILEQHRRLLPKPALPEPEAPAIDREAA